MFLQLIGKAKRLKDHPFARKVATLQVGQFSASIIQSGIGIIIARVLQPELYGVYSLAFGLASLTTLIIGMGIQEAVSSMLGRAYAQKDKAEVENILGFMLKITSFATLVTVLIMTFLPTIADKWYGNSLIGIYAAIVSFAVVFSSLIFTLTYSSYQVAGRVKQLSTLIASDYGFRYTFSLIFVLVGWKVAGAVAGQLVGAIIVFMFASYLYRKLTREDFNFPSPRKLIKAAWYARIKKYLRFTFWVALDRNLGNVYMALPVILTGIYVSASEVSYFKLAFGFMNLAMGLLGPISILLNVEFPKIQIEEKERLLKNFRTVSWGSFGLSALLAAAASIAAPIAFRVLYGESYLPSIQYVAGLFLYGAFMGIGVGLGPMWRAVDKVKTSLIINGLVLGLGVPLGLWLIKMYGLWGSVAMVTIWFAVSHWFSYIYLVNYLKKHVR